MQATAAENGRKTTSENVIDVRGIQPPDNILAILKKAAEVPPGASFEVMADCNPFQLYDLLQQRGFFLEMTREANGCYRGRVRPRDAAAPGH